MTMADEDRQIIDPDRLYAEGVESLSRLGVETDDASALAQEIVDKAESNPAFGDFMSDLAKGKPEARMLLEELGRDAWEREGHTSFGDDMGTLYSNLLQAIGGAELMAALGEDERAAAMIRALAEQIRIIRLEVDHPQPRLRLPRYACEQCRFRLNRIRTPQGGVHWVHGRVPEDRHMAKMVLEEMVQVRFACDFCSSPDPTWSFGSADSTSIFVSGGVEWERNSQGDAWMACESCRLMIQSGDMEGVTRRAVEQIEDRWDFKSDPTISSREDLFERFAAAHREFLEHRAPERDHSLQEGQ